MKHRDVEYVTALADTYRIPLQAWQALQAKGVVLPYEYAQERCCAKPQPGAAAAAATVEVETVTSSAVSTTRQRSNATRRPNRRQRLRQRLTLCPGSDDHKWLKRMLMQHGLTSI